MIDDLFENLHPWKLTWNIMEISKITQFEEGKSSEPNLRTFGVPYIFMFPGCSCFLSQRNL